MGAQQPADDRAATLLERRWFAADRAAAEIRAKCDALTQVRDEAANALREARSRLSYLLALRDALGDEMSAVDERPLHPRRGNGTPERGVSVVDLDVFAIPLAGEMQLPPGLSDFPADGTSFSNR